MNHHSYFPVKEGKKLLIIERSKESFVTIELVMPPIYCSYPVFTGSLVLQINETDVRIFRTERDKIYIQGLSVWLTYIVKLYSWCGTEMEYFEQNYFTGPGGE